MDAATQYQLESATNQLIEVLHKKDGLSPKERESLQDAYTGLSLICYRNPGSESFSQWLDRQRRRKDRTGELARWSLQDSKWPQHSGRALTPFVERLRLTNLTIGALRLPGAAGSDLIEQYLFPAWDEYVEATEPRQLSVVAGIRR